jgi:hypothetical protein
MSACQPHEDGGKLHVAAQRADVTLALELSAWNDLIGVAGQMELDVVMSGSMSEPFVLRQNGLLFKHCALKPAHATSWNELRWTTDNVAKTVTLKMDKLAVSGPARLRLEWTNDLADKSAFLTHSTPDCFYLVANPREGCGDAGSLFPHFDQPCRYKFSFSNVPAGASVVLGNGKMQSEVDDSGTGLKRVTFARTWATPANAVSFCMGTFVADQKEIRVDALGFGSETVRVRLRRLKKCSHCASRAGSCHRMFDHVCAALERMMELLQMAHPYESIEVVAVPLKLPEQRLWCLLSPIVVDKESFQCNAPSNREEIVIQSVVRRLLRNWVRAYLATAEFSFVLDGLLVFLEYYFTGSICSDWAVWDKFQVEVFDPILRGHSDDRALRYACHFRHLKQFLGKTAFFQAIRKYGLLMREHGESENLPFLWNALEAERGPSSSSSVELLERVLVVRRDAREMVVEQHYLDAARRLLPSVACVHVVARFGPNMTNRFLLSDTKTTLLLSTAGPERFYFLNAKSAGLYRVWYSEQMLQDLWLNVHALRDVEFASLLLDLLALFPTMYEANTWAAAMLVKFLKEVGRIKASHMWRLLMPAFSRLLVHLQLQPEYEMVAAVLRPPVMKMARKLLGKFNDCKPPERCQLETDALQLLLSQLCCVSDFWTPMVAAAAASSLEAFGQSKEVTDPEQLLNLIKPIYLAGAAPCLAESTGQSLLQRVNSSTFPAWSKPHMERALFLCVDFEVLQSHISTRSSEEMLMALLLCPSRPLAVSVLQLRRSKAWSEELLAEATRLSDDSEGRAFREAFASLAGRVISDSSQRRGSASSRKNVIFQYLPIVTSAAALAAFGYLAYQAWSSRNHQ